jgi:hypothetical protein
LGVRLQPEIAPLKKGERWVLGSENTVAIIPTLDESTVETFEYSLNNQAFVDSPSRIFFQNDGDYSLRVRGVAKNGEKGAIVEQLVEVDRTAPVITVKVATVGSQRRVTITADDKNGIESILYRSQRVFKAYSAPFLIRTGARIDIRVRDSVGNERSIKRFAK